MGLDESSLWHCTCCRSVVRAEQGSWSWKPYTYRKKQVCDSEPRFIRPGYAQDSTGKWQVIVQTDAMPQRVAIDLCRTPGQPCEYVKPKYVPGHQISIATIMSEIQPFNRDLII